MLVARDQENRVQGHHNGAGFKQQGQINRQLKSKTPGSKYPKTPVKIPLNDENVVHHLAGAKSILGGRTRGNENAATVSQGLNGLDNSKFVTPMEPRVRAILGDKTTNAKARGQGAINVKSAGRDIEKSQMRLNTILKPKNKLAQSETQKLAIHAEESDPLGEEEEDIEYAPPRAKNIPYQSDVYPDGALTFEGLKPENLMKGYHQHYFNPRDEEGVLSYDRELDAKNRKVMEELDTQVRADIDAFEWDVPELRISRSARNKAPLHTDISSSNTSKKDTMVIRRAPSTLTSRTAASALSMTDTTRSVQRRVAREVMPPKKKKAAFLPLGSRSAKPPSGEGRSSSEAAALEAKSRTTIGYSKGRATASVLHQGTVNAGKPKFQGVLPRSETTTSNDSDMTITPARFAYKKASAAAAEDQEWKQRVPFLSIFDSNDENDDLGVSSLSLNLREDQLEEEEEEFELELVEETGGVGNSE